MEALNCDHVSGDGQHESPGRQRHFEKDQLTSGVKTRILRMEVRVIMVSVEGMECLLASAAGILYLFASMVLMVSDRTDLSYWWNNTH